LLYWIWIVIFILVPASTTSAAKGRTYDASGRRRQAQANRRRIVEAAHRLFLEQGYGATSLDEIADAAGVSTPTVYAKFGSKAGLLKVVVDVAVAGDDEELPLADRPEFRAVVSDSPLPDRIGLAAELAAEIHRRSGPVLRLVGSVAGSDPAVAELHATLQAQLRETADSYVPTIPAGSLRPGLSERRASDLIFAYGHPEMWSTLVEDCGWTSEQYVDWLVEVLSSTVFDLGGSV
jgi:AcrR family transcriptional regulator